MTGKHRPKVVATLAALSPANRDHLDRVMAKPAPRAICAGTFCSWLFGSSPDC